MKKKTSFTLSEDCLAFLSKIATEKGLSMAATIELLSREEAKRLKIKLDNK